MNDFTCGFNDGAARHDFKSFRHRSEARSCAQRVMALLFGVAAATATAGAPTPGEFAWRAQLAPPGGASMARVELPAQALMRLQSADARDLRVFNAAGEAVPFTLVQPGAAATPAPALSASYPAFPLLAGTAGKKPHAGAVSVRIVGADGPRSVWVRLEGPGGAAGAQDGSALPSAIFTTRDEKQTLSAILVQGNLPPNQPVHVTAATSADLAQWTPLALRGRLYRFEGAGAPSNDRLEFEQPQRLQGRYLRLDWQGHEGVQVRAIQGVVAQAQAAPRLLRAPLPAPTQVGPGLIEWRLDFATPMATLTLSTTRANFLAPVRILSRNEASQPWRQIGQSVLFRLGSAGSETSNPALSLNQTARWLRVESTLGQALDVASIQAAVEFWPVQVVFIASGGAPYQLTAGRSDTPLAAMAGATFSSAMPGDLNQLPVAAISNIEQSTAGDRAGWLNSLPGGISGRDLALWGALLGGVLLLGAVAFTLLRQLNAARPEAASKNLP